jgi:hypothetical protein
VHLASSLKARGAIWECLAANLSLLCISFRDKSVAEGIGCLIVSPEEMLLPLPMMMVRRRTTTITTPLLDIYLPPQVSPRLSLVETSYVFFATAHLIINYFERVNSKCITRTTCLPSTISSTSSYISTFPQQETHRSSRNLVIPLVPAGYLILILMLFLPNHHHHCSSCY